MRRARRSWSKKRPRKTHRTKMVYRSPEHSDITSDVGVQLSVIAFGSFPPPEDVFRAAKGNVWRRFNSRASHLKQHIEGKVPSDPTLLPQPRDG